MRDGTWKLPTPDSHVDNGYGAKTMVYNMKKELKEGDRRKTEEKGRLKKYNSKKKQRTLNY